MTYTKDEALKLALEAITTYLSESPDPSNEAVEGLCDAASAVRKALAAPVQPLPFGVGGGLVAIKTLLSRDPCGHANTAIKMIDAILAEQPAPLQPLTWLKTIETPGGFGKFVEAKPNEKGAKPVYTAPPAQEIVCSTGLCHYKPAAQPAQKRHVSYVCPQCHWSLEKQSAPVQEPVAWFYRDNLGRPCSTTKKPLSPFKDMQPLYTTPPAAPDLQAELDATNRQVEILSDALAESRREVAALTAVQELAKVTIPEGMVLVPYEPSVEMQEQGSTAAGYELSQKRARYVYQSMIDMHVLREGAEPTDQWFRIQAGYTTPPAELNK
jgi:hypothetical protein